jgi:hypothetical protein
MLRWLMKHPIMLAWLLAIVAILLNFGVGSKQGEQAEAVVAHDATAQQAAPAEMTAAPAAEPAKVEVAAAPAAEPAKVEVAVAAPATEPAKIDVAAVVAAAEPAKVEVAVAAPAAEPAKVEVAVAAPAAEPAKVEVAVAAPAAEPAKVDVAVAAPAAEPAKVDVAAAPQASANAPADLLRAAREAYWANELDRAVGLYTDLLKQTPDSLEYKGELANVYWKQGNAEQASKLFAEVAPQLAEQGRMSEALNMKLYVDMVNPELAKQIDAALKK